MADEEQLVILKQGVEVWNAWRAEHTHIRPDLRGADLFQANLQGANLSESNLCEAELSGASLGRANMSRADLTEASLFEASLNQADLTRACLLRAYLFGADLHGADLREADLREANLSGAVLFRTTLFQADLREADLSESNLSEADLSEADLRGADLRRATLVKTDFAQARLSGCAVYGVSAWDVQLEGAMQTNLVINAPGEPLITVDNLKLAQFLYLMMHNDEIRDVVDTLTSKVVLILGRFTPERKAVLDALREALRQRNYVPVLFDFEGPASLNTTETATLLARMARFIIADLTEPSSLPQELQAIVPDVMVPVQPLLLKGARHHSMFPDLRRYPWMLPIYRYASLDALLTSMQEQVIAPAEAKVIEVRKLRQAAVDTE